MDTPCQQWFKPGYFLFAISISPLILLLHVPWWPVIIFLIMSCQFMIIACRFIQIWIWWVAIAFLFYALWPLFWSIDAGSLLQFLIKFYVSSVLSLSPLGLYCSSEWWVCKADFRRKRSLEQFSSWLSWCWVLLFLAPLSSCLPERFMVTSS